MKKIVISYLALAFLLFPSQLLAFDKQNGFLNIKWGESIESCKSKEICKTCFNDFDKTWCIIDIINLKELNPTGALFGFKNNKFCSVIIKFEDKNNFDFLNKELQNLYGNDYDSVSKYIGFQLIEKKISWKRDNVETNLNFLFETNTGSLILNHVFINNEPSENKRILNRKLLGPVQ